MSPSLQKIFWFSLIVKLGLSAWIPLSADEAYYWVWSKHLQLSYFDHPVGVALLYWLGQPLENFFSAIRWPGVILGHTTLYIWIQALQGLLTPPQLKVFFWMALLSPLTGPGSLIVTPDLPMLFFGALSFLLMSRIPRQLEQSSSAELAMGALLVGLSLGLSFTGKYTAVLFAPALLVWGFSWKLSFRNLLLMILSGLMGWTIFASPPFIWNAMNDWISFSFQIDHGLGGKKWLLKNTWHYLAAQVGLIFPTVLWLAFKAKAPLWLKVAGWFPILFFLFTTTRGYVEANWPISGYLPLLALASLAQDSSQWIKRTLWVWGSALLLVLSLIIYFWLPVPIEKIKLKELYRYNIVSKEIAETEPVFARTYQMASKLSFNLKRPIYKLRGLNRFDNFDLWEGSMPTTDFFYLVAEPSDVLPNDIALEYELIEKKSLSEGYELWRFERK